jgi:hypothetical protein
MNFQFKIQDPSNPATTYLLEEIIGLVRRGDLIKWRGIYSWTTGKTLTRVFLEDPDVNDYLENGEVELVIGLDAITTDYALQKLSELNESFEGFESKVFHNEVCDLFHPKISHFEFENGEHVLLVGSGNFTLTGLQTNIEAYTITTGSAAEIPTLNAWDDFLAFHNEGIKEIDEEAIEKAKKNRVKFVRKKKIVEAEVEAEEEVEAAEGELEEEVEEIVDTPIAARLAENSRVLIAQVPAAGGRWRQIHYNAAVIEQFFQAQANSNQRIFLKEVRLDGTLGSDEVRPVVYSSSNKNYKIEVSSHLDSDYPNEGKPIIVLREVGVRNFLYMLIMPDEPPYNAFVAFLDENPSVGKGLKRVITDAEHLKNVWDNCPLVE